jgi:NAD(P)-dependent dehydrogenase (short-subunit alcohol dehydrogenase family)
MSQSTNGVVLIGGANGALGGAVLARALADGQRVIGLERSKSGETTLERVNASHLVLRANTADGAALGEALARAEAELGGPLTGAVLTAGAWRGGQLFHEDGNGESFRAVLESNLESASVALRAILPGLLQRRHGSVVLIGARAGVRPFGAAGEAAYATAKAALTALAQAVAAEALSASVRVNLVLPSTIDTPANRQATPDADFSRWVTLESLTGVIAFLLSEAARDISGAALPVYGRVVV